MNLILYKWGGFNEDLLERKLIECGHQVAVLEAKCEDYTKDMNLAFKIMQAVYKEHAQAVISFDYFPIISLACDTCKVLYYSWVYDSPMTTVYAKAARLSCNRIGVFDKDLVNHFNSYGIDTVFHALLPTDVQDYQNRANNRIAGFGNLRDGGKCDISFVGSLYTDHSNYYDLFKDEDLAAGRLSDSSLTDVRSCTKGVQESNISIWNRLDEIIEEQAFSYDTDCLDKCDFAYEYLKEKMRLHGLCLDDEFDVSEEEIIRSDVLEKRVTVVERQTLMRELAKLSDGRYSFNLYTTSDTSYDDLVNRYNCGKIDYVNEMPKVFNRSRINIHISLRSIHSGIPQRAIDIPACGGFLLANDAAELREYFEVGKEVEIFSSIEECIDKVKYFLEHDELRQKIAIAGYEKVRKVFSYEKGLERLLS